MRRILWLFSLGAISVLALSFASYLVLSQVHPDREISLMLQAMGQVQTARTRVALSWTRGDAARRTSTLYATGQVDRSRPGDVQLAESFRAFQFGAEDRYADVSGEIRRLAGDTYLTYHAPGPVVQGVAFEQEGTWIRFPDGELHVWGSLIPGFQPPALLGGDASWDARGIGEALEFLPYANVFKADPTFAEETWRGEDVRVIDATVDPARLRAVLLALAHAKLGRDLEEEDRIRVEWQARALDGLAFRFWIRKDDRRLRRVQAAGTAEEQGEDRLTLVDLIAEFEDFDAPFEGKAPAEARSLREVLGSVFGFLPKADAAADVARRAFFDDPAAAFGQLPTMKATGDTDPDGDGLPDLLEAFYGTDRTNSDTDGDGVSDGDEVRQGTNPRGEGSLFGFGLDL